MHGAALARWVQRHSPAERLRASLDLADAAIAEMVARVERTSRDATPRDVRAAIARLRNGR